MGTFNPEWDNPNGGNANWFYGRPRNSFWNIMPQAFGHPNLKTPQNQANPEAWKQYCLDNGIGLTDIIECIEDANEHEHHDQIMGFLDNELELFQEILLTDIPSLIDENKESLCGVYLTRYSHTLNVDSVFLHRWMEIENQCEDYGIHHSCLVTPSNGYMMPVVNKIELWQNQINICD